MASYVHDTGYPICRRASSKSYIEHPICCKYPVYILLSIDPSNPLLCTSKG